MIWSEIRFPWKSVMSEDFSKAEVLGDSMIIKSQTLEQILALLVTFK